MQPWYFIIDAIDIGLLFRLLFQTLTLIEKKKYDKTCKKMFHDKVMDYWSSFYN